MTRLLTYVEIDVPAFSGAPLTETFRFAVPTAYLPQDIDAIPSIESVSFSPALISLGQNLGQRASLTISFKDHRHVFAGEPFEQGTFWGKWRGRYGTKLRGCAVRLIRGQVGQPIEAMDIRHYVIDSTDGPDFSAVYTAVAKDILKLADDDRAQSPRLSNGRLAGSISAVATAATLSPISIGNAEYPASGWVCLGGKEVASFTRAGDMLTIARGQFGTVTQAHDAGDRVQLVLRYTGNDPAAIIRDLLVNYAGVPVSTIDLAEWQAETSAYLNVIYAATITEPTSVNKLISELIEQAALAVWWDDRAKNVRLHVLREISTDADTFDHERIIAGSFSVKEQPLRRISQIWTYYGQRDPTDSGANEDNYRAALATVDLALEGEYGSAEIKKIQARWVETLTAANRLNSIQLSRFRDPPRVFGFDLFRDQAVTLAGGYQVKWWGNQNSEGNEVPAKIQVTRITIHPDRVHVEAEEMLASGTVVLVNVVFLTTTGDVFDFEVPATWNDADNSVECIGGGAGGSTNNASGGSGGGGGAYSRQTNINLTPGASVSYRVGAGGPGAGPGQNPGTDGGDTWFNGVSLAASTVGAQGGNGGPVSVQNGGDGGQAANGTGSLKFSGGDGGARAGGDPNSGSGGGGGAAGPHGEGADGGVGFRAEGAGGGGADDGSPGANGNTGVGGNNRFNFGGGTDGGGFGDEGGGGGGSNVDQGQAGHGGDGEQLWTQTVPPITSAGPGGGAGRGGAGGDGGDYGGGGGGGGDDGPGGGDGAQGVIVLTWREAE